MPRILVVDDDEMFLDIYEDLLADQGHEVILAQNGSAALASAQEQAPDLIIMDLNMPGMTGLAVIRKLRAEAATAKTPILAITAQEAVHVYEDIYDAGADGYLGKPIDGPRLIDRITKMLAS